MNQRTQARIELGQNLLTAGLGCCLGLALGCATTITPRTVTSSQASWDGNKQNSGFIGFDRSGNGILTERAHARYTGLVQEFGGRFVPVVKPDEGIASTSTNTFLIDAEHLQKFMEMSRWKKQPKPQ